MLVIRLLLFGLIQTAIALFLGLFGTFNAFSASTKWWPVSDVLTNFIYVNYFQDQKVSASPKIRRLAREIFREFSS